jgi:hypothetical protein
MRPNDPVNNRPVQDRIKILFQWLAVSIPQRVYRDPSISQEMAFRKKKLSNEG